MIHLVNVLIEEGYLNSCEKIDNGGKDEISVNLKYFNGKPAIKDLKRISRPGLRKYSGTKDLSLIISRIQTEHTVCFCAVLGPFSAPRLKI